jgi:ectoine hydroxylase-related dioxygenase (phytanoyl-CoA dioxygenase family)
MLSVRHHRSFRDNGFLVLPGFFEEAELAAASGAYHAVWRDLPGDVTVDTEISQRRTRAAQLTEEERAQSFKINDLYLREPRLREAVLSERLGAILRELLGDAPVICNTLSLEYGSQQADHLDTLFMTPPSYGRLVATWMALEDVVADAGPLRYYPESNHIEPFRFEDGGFHVRNEEMDRWSDYMAGEVERHGLAETRFLAKRGDLFIWDAWLLHGGSEICKPGLTRHSLVTHYFAEKDCRELGGDLRPVSGGLWMKRPPQAVPGEENPPSETAEAPTVEDTPAGEIPTIGAPAGSRVQPAPAQSLRERMDALVDSPD